jgi:simple sugar transport system ATP-binding protein
VNMESTVEMVDITKRFGNVVANDKVSFSCKGGHIHGLIGENGAGKTTLMKVLYGMHQPDEGDIRIRGEKVRLNSPKAAICQGIGMVHQHFTLVPSLTVAQNIILGRPPLKKTGAIDIKAAISEVERMSKDYNLKVDPKAVVDDYPVGVRQRVEILKALYLGADILILDEPTAILTPQEISQLFETLLALKEKGKSIILITHKLAEIMRATDDITILRNGIVTGHISTCDTNEEEIAGMMVGTDTKLTVQRQPSTPGEVCLRAKALSYRNKFGVKMLDNVSLEVHRGEIVGIAGVQGNGQTELIDAITGFIDDGYVGEVWIDGKAFYMVDGVDARRRQGLTHIPEDRQTRGGAPDASLLQNFTMNNFNEPDERPCPLINWKRQKRRAERHLNDYRVKFDRVENPAYSLSGGNMQKAIVAREMVTSPRVIIAAQPSRGVDIGAMIFIHERLLAKRSEGAGILLVSYELSEIMSLCDRILVMYNGRIMGELQPEQTTEEEIGLLMARMPIPGGAS